jgi:predicted ATPase
MLDKITLENFKAFKKLDNLPIKPITILCGTNSSGKSSILQSILMLKQTLESINPNQTLLLNGRFTKLGAFEDVIYQKKAENVVKIGLKFSNDNFYGFGNLDLPRLYDFEEERINVDLEIEYEIINGKPDLKKIEIQDLEISHKSEPCIGQFQITKNKENSYDIEWNCIPGDSFSGKIKGKLSSKNISNLQVEFPNTSNSDEIASYFSHRNLFKSFNLSGNNLKQIFQTLHYLGPLRGEPEREYIYRDEVLEIGNKGENAAYLFLTEKDKEIENHYFYNKRKDDFKQIDKITLEKALAKWFNIIGVKDFSGEVINKIIYLSLNANKSDETKVGIADVGFGISQIFPIFLEGLRMEVGSTLMLEQPEIHLHPNLQMQLSDYFIALAKSGKRFLVETHSDHVVNRLVRRIVEDETGSLKDLIGIYFIKPSDEGSVYEEITIDERKGIVNWPKDFFDQAANEQLKIMQAGLKKRHKNGQTI